MSKVEELSQMEGPISHLNNARQVAVLVIARIEAGQATEAGLWEAWSAIGLRLAAAYYAAIRIATETPDRGGIASGWLTALNQAHFDAAREAALYTMTWNQVVPSSDMATAERMNCRLGSLLWELEMALTPAGRAVA